MNGANHRMSSITTYPFNIMGNGWEIAMPSLADLPFKGDTVVGNDITIDRFCKILFMLPVYDTLLAFSLCLISWPNHFLSDHPILIIDSLAFRTIPRAIDLI